ncbi:extracellular solute-binding protein [Georgenia sp. 10Sc9-8]|uniref:Extracellular solute-binding protein n=1 Tax=Georgenia halotolerans TaxID=3028317 RepID=A0ABT5TVL1_9MICO|nr:extracellular solute-binding protein [Georgenia halotolerans]
MKRHTTGVLAAAASASLVLAACGGGDTGDGGGGGDDGEPVTLRFQSLAWQEESVQANQDIVEAWNAENREITVEYVQGDWGSVHDQLLTSFEGGDPPDIIHYEAAAGQVFADGGYYADLEPLLSEDFRSSIPDDIWSTVEHEEYGTTGVPFLLEARVALANRTMLEEAGIEVPTPDSPWTWDEFQDAALQLTTEDRYGVAFPLASPASAMFNLSMNFGGDYVTGEGEDMSIEVGEEELEVPTRVHSMLYEDESANPENVGVNTTDSLPGFFAGESAMIFGAIWLRQQMVQQAPEGFDWVTLPPLEGDEGSTQSANPQTLSVAAQSEHPEEAAQFIEYFLNDENMAQLALGDWLVPTSEGALAELEEQTGGEQGWDVAVASLDSLTAAPWQNASGFQEFMDRTATPAFQRFFADEITAEQLAEELESGGTSLGG